MKYELSEWDIDIISHALKNRIDYLEGMIMIHEQFQTKEPEQIAYLKVLLRETKRVQNLTTYEGQSIFLKDQNGFIDLDELAKLFKRKFA
nr:hypothetical protein [uncultured Dysosmobacter sp.]